MATEAEPSGLLQPTLKPNPIAGRAWVRSLLRRFLCFNRHLIIPASLCNHTGLRPAVILGQEITPSPPPPSAQGALNLSVYSHSSVALLPA